jgi:hypothetical protein
MLLNGKFVKQERKSINNLIMKTAEEYNVLIEKAHQILEDSNVLFELERNEHDWFSRQITLQRVIADESWRFGFDLADTFQPWIIPRIAYEIQQRKGIDFGYCKHFQPQYERQMRENIEGNLTVDTLPLCNYCEGDDVTSYNGLLINNCGIAKEQKSPDYYSPPFNPFNFPKS